MACFAEDVLAIHMLLLVLILVKSQYVSHLYAYTPIFTFFICLLDHRLS
jgi:hypothetical protein